jgi:hypothetical protein
MDWVRNQECPSRQTKVNEGKPTEMTKTRYSPRRVDSHRAFIRRAFMCQEQPTDDLNNPLRDTIWGSRNSEILARLACVLSSWIEAIIQHLNDISKTLAVELPTERNITTIVSKDDMPGMNELQDALPGYRAEVEKLKSFLPDMRPGSSKLKRKRDTSETGD